MTGDRRKDSRREHDEREVIATHWVFDRQERVALKLLERRREVRREGDVSARIARLG